MENQNSPVDIVCTFVVHNSVLRTASHSKRGSSTPYKLSTNFEVFVVNQPYGSDVESQMDPRNSFLQ